MHPDWVLKHKAKGTNISRIRGKYYLYEVGSVWNREKGRAQKITKKYLGRITEEGLVAPKENCPKIQAPVSVKEFGAAAVVAELGKDILQKLEEAFPEEARRIFALAAMRVVEPNPFKRAERQYHGSYLSEMFGELKLSGKDISLFLREFGGRREEMARFMRGFIGENAHLLFDGTSIVSQPEKMDINRVGYNAHREYKPQVNLLYAFACGSRMPAYYRKEDFLERQFKFGAIILRSNLQKTPEEIYAIYKERREIEQTFDFLKNLLEQDKTHMQNERSLEAWAFINHIALMLHYKLYNLLREKKLLAKFSVADFISHLKYIFKVKAGQQWLTSEISAKTAGFLGALGMHIT